LEKTSKVRKLRTRLQAGGLARQLQSPQEAFVSAYIAGLKAEVERDQAQRADLERANVQAARERLTPLEDRLARLLQTIPHEIQREGLSLSQLQVQLRGRWRGACHPGDLGDALRKLGFVRRRNWRDGVGFRAQWYPSYR
jgi:hypothetical protein